MLIKKLTKYCWELTKYCKECIKPKYYEKSGCNRNEITKKFEPCVIGWEYENIKTLKLRSTRMWLKHRGKTLLKHF